VRLAKNLKKDQCRGTEVKGGSVTKMRGARTVCKASEGVFLGGLVRGGCNRKKKRPTCKVRTMGGSTLSVGKRGNKSSIISGGKKKNVFSP